MTCLITKIIVVVAVVVVVKQMEKSQKSAQIRQLHYGKKVSALQQRPCSDSLHNIFYQRSQGMSTIMGSTVIE